MLVALGGCLTAGIAAVAQQRGIQLRSVRATVAAEMDLHGILGVDPDVRNGFSGVRVDYRDRRRRDARGDRGAGRAVAEAVGGLRHPDQPDRGHGHGELTVRHTTTVVVGAGHCGLAMSRRLAERSIDHVVLERGEVAHSWRTQRWDSLRLLTPNWMTRLPGHAYSGADPDGYLAVPELVGLLGDYAGPAPVLTGTTVTSVRPHGQGYGWAPTGAPGTRGPSWWRPARPLYRPTRPSRSPGDHLRDLRGLPQPRPATRRWRAGRRRLGERRPDRRGARPVRETGDAGRRRARADAAHLPGPRHPVVDGRVGPARRALGRDSGSGTGPRTCHRCSWSARRARSTSPRCAGSGCALVGRLAGIRDGSAQFAGSLANVTALADLKLGRLLDTLDTWADRTGVDADPPQRFAPTEMPDPPALSARLGPGGIETVVWATGFRPDLSFLDTGVFDRKGRVVHDGGVTAAPGLYLMGLPFLRRRSSTLIDGAAADARDLAEHLVRYLGSLARPRAS